MKFQFKSNKYIFKPRIFPSIAFLTALSILLSLSTWQFKSLQWKKKLISERISSFEQSPVKFDEIYIPEDNEFRKVLVKGKLLNDKEMFMPALSRRGNNGFHILVPLQTDRERMIIYDSGWIPLHKKNKELREKNIFEEEMVFEAVIRTSGRKGYFQPENDLKTNTWFFVEPELMSKYTKLDFDRKYYLEAISNGPNGFPLGNQTRIYLRNNHLQSALTWLMIAMGLIGVCFFANIRKN